MEVSVLNKKNLVIGIIIVALGGILLSRGQLMNLGNFGKKEIPAVAAKTISVKVMNPTIENRKVGMSYKATLEAFQEALVSSQVNGKVIQVLFENGQKVQKGAALVQVDDRDARSQLKIAYAQLEASKATLIKIEAGLSNTKNNYNRAKELYQSGAISQVELDNSRAALDMLMADIATAKAGIATAEGTVEFRKTALENMTLKAPISGMMDGKSVKLGQSVSPEGMLGKVKDVSQIDAIFEIDQAALSEIQVGQKAQVRLQGVEGKVYEGVVHSIDLSADPSSRVFKAKVRLNNEKSELRPGVFAWVDLRSTKETAVMTLPVELILGKEGGFFVFVNENGVARRKMVMLGEVFDNRVEIKAGINEKVQIVTTNLSTIQDGDTLTIMTK